MPVVIDASALFELVVKSELGVPLLMVQPARPGPPPARQRVRTTLPATLRS